MSDQQNMSDQKKKRYFGQFIILIALIGIVTIGISTLLGTTVSVPFSQIDSGLTGVTDGSLSTDSGSHYSSAPRNTPVSMARNDTASRPEPTVAQERNATRSQQEDTEYDFVLAVKDNLSTFGMDVDTASYSIARNALMNGTMLNAESVRIEEFVNYFDYRYTPPVETALGISIDSAPVPWEVSNDARDYTNQVVRVGIQGKEIDDSERPDATLIFVIDVSGSMGDTNRLPLVKQTLSVLVNELRETDKVGIVVYSDNTRIVLKPTSAANRSTILQAINSLQTEGSTNVEEGLREGYEMASRYLRPDGINRVILCSDGLANVGAVTPGSIRQTVQDYADQGVLLTTVGFGMGEYNDTMMEQLADDGNGNYAYVDTLEEAKRVFVENLTGTLQVIAKDAKVQVEFNKDVVHSFRLLGYENRAIADSDFRNDSVDAGEIGPGHNVTALYEVRLNADAEGEMLNVFLRYADPESGEVTELNQPFQTNETEGDFASASPSLRLAVAAANFAKYLRQDDDAYRWSLRDIQTVADRVALYFDDDTDVAEFAMMVSQAHRVVN